MENPENQPPAPQSNLREFTVSELSFAIKRTVEAAYGYVRLRGEVSGYRGPHSSGHCYFALKDEKARIEAVIWRGVFARLPFKPEEGMEVIATGRVTTYPGSSKYQIVIDALEPAGIGALLAQLEKLKQKLAAEGLFDEARKKLLPFLPRIVGIVTSPMGAVIRDMLHGFEERFPVHVVVWPVRVQGESCSAEVAAAIRGFNALGPDAPVPRPDLLIVARGGGSLEDLWGFNAEIVARAAADSAIPLISAVGHESDWTLIDFVADARAPTPTKAAEWAVPMHSELLSRTGELARRQGVALRRFLEHRRAALRAVTRGLPRAADILALPRQRLDAAAARLPFALRSNTARHRANLERLSGRLRPAILRQSAARHRRELTRLGQRADRALVHLVQRMRAAIDARGQLLASLSHRGVLARGFALVRDQAGAMVRSAGGLKPGDPFEVEFSDGRVPATAGKAAVKPEPETKQTGAGGGSQGSLF